MRKKGGTIVYVRSIQECEQYAQKLGCAYYHTEAKNADEAARMKDFLATFLAWYTDLIVCTAAAAAGLDRPDIRDVIHARLPYGLIEWAQAVGRTDRDGLPAEATICCSDTDIYRASTATNTPFVDDATLDGVQLRGFVQAGRCRREKMSRAMDADVWACGELGKDTGCDTCDSTRA
ncbi:unnamed protein product [Tilletia controversa]|nr:unnamed protein product [Tilletia controversa]CAD6968000.1 unnamed protein product [Tilletia controversa]